MEISTLIRRLARTSNVALARRLLSRFNKEERKSIVSKQGRDDAPLFVAAERGRAAMVTFLVKECSADVEEQGMFKIDGNTTPVTPLWCAAAVGRLDVIRVLAGLGADVNAVSDNEWTSLAYACSKSSIEVAQLLIQLGADMRKTDINGETCLMHAVHSVQLCQVLINYGASVNTQSFDGSTALHIAIEEDYQDTVFFLLDRGSDPYIRNSLGDDALQTACLRGNEGIVRDLISKINPSLSRCIQSYQLLGAFFIDEMEDIDTAMTHWRTALEIKISHTSDGSNEMEPEPGDQDLNTEEVLESLHHNHDMAYMHSLMIQERILGPFHDCTLFGLEHRSEFYFSVGDYERAIHLWKIAFHRRNMIQSLTGEYLSSLEALNKMAQEWQDVQFTDLFEVLQMITSKLESDIRVALTDEHPDELIQTLMKSTLQLVKCIAGIYKSPDQLFAFKQIVHRIVRSGKTTQNGRTFLHFASDETTSPSRGDFSGSALVELLLECGADVNSVDLEKNTALHLCSEELRKRPDQDEMKKVVDVLLRYSAHIDAINTSGDIAAKGLMISTLEHVSLKCMAANVIQMYRIPYVGHLPVDLIPFVQMHGQHGESASN